MNKNKKRGGGSAPKGGDRKGARKGKRQSFKEDPFFSNESKKRLKYDDEIRSDDESDDDRNDAVGLGSGEEEDEAAEEIIEETPGEKKLRLTKEYLKRLGDHERKKKEDEDEESDDESEKEGERDSLVAKLLQQQQLQDSGRLRRAIASRYPFLLQLQFFFQSNLVSCAALVVHFARLVVLLL